MVIVGRQCGQFGNVIRGLGFPLLPEVTVGGDLEVVVFRMSLSRCPAVVRCG